MAAVLAAGIALSFALGAALVTSVISAAPASAHAVLVRITPAARAQLTTAPTQVVVGFNEPVSSTFVTVAVTSAAGTNVAQGEATVEGATVTQLLSPGLASGDYRIAFRVTSNDGHPISGESQFTLAPTPTARPQTSAATASSTPTPTSTSTSTSTSTVSQSPLPQATGADAQRSWLTRFLAPIAGAVGLLVLGAGVLLWDRRRR